MAYKPGENGNQGQVRAKPIRDALYALLSRPADDLLNDQPKTMAQKIALDLMRDAMSTSEKIRVVRVILRGILGDDIARDCLAPAQLDVHHIAHSVALAQIRP